MERKNKRGSAIVLLLKQMRFPAFLLFSKSGRRTSATCGLPMAGACSRWPPGSSPAMQVRDAAILSLLTHSAPVPGPSPTQATHRHIRACDQRHCSHGSPTTRNPRTTCHLLTVLRTPRWLHSIVCPVGAGGLRERLHGAGIVPRRRVRVPAGLDLL